TSEQIIIFNDKDRAATFTHQSVFRCYFQDKGKSLSVSFFIQRALGETAKQGMRHGDDVTIHLVSEFAAEDLHRRGTRCFDAARHAKRQAGAALAAGSAGP